MLHALIDSDIVAYRAAVLTPDSSDSQEAVALFDRIFSVWMDISSADCGIHCLSSPFGYRQKAWYDYKANRRDIPRPKHLKAVRDHALAKGAIVHTGWEADDIMGFLQTMPHGEKTIIVTVDKDLDQVSGLHCNPDKGIRYTVDTDTAEKYKWIQVLTGDPTDNYPGVKGIGIKKANKILEDVEGDFEAVVWSVYESRGLDKKFFDSMKICATILQFTKEIECALLSQDTSEATTLQRLLASIPSSGD